MREVNKYLFQKLVIIRTCYSDYMACLCFHCTDCSFDNEKVDKIDSEDGREYYYHSSVLCSDADQSSSLVSVPMVS